MKQNLLSASRLGSLACLLVLHLCPVTASRAAVLAGPITNAANGHIYYLLSPTNWPSAEAEAVSLHGHLATINDVAENTWVFNTFGSFGGVARSLWIGLNDMVQEGNWVWVGGETSAYRKWAPGEPNNGGGYFPNEDQAVMRGPALAYSDSWNDAPGDQAHAAVVEVAIAAPPTHTGAYDVASGFSTASNPNGVWSYGSSTTLGSPMTLLPDRGNWAGLDYWRAAILLGVPGVYHNPANITVTNSTGTAVLGPGQLSFYPGPNGEFCIIRFTAPTHGLYQVTGAFTGVDPHGTTTDVHILVNGVIFNGSVNGFGTGSGPAFNLIADLNAGDPIDFAVGRSANSQFSFDSTGLAVQIVPPGGVAPTITSHPQNQSMPAGSNATFTVVATGTAPLSYQWRRNETNLPGATGTSLTLSNVQPANAGTYSVRVTNAFGAVTSSNAVLTILALPTNCVPAPSGLVSWWRAEGNANDSVRTNNGTTPFGIAYAAGEVGQAFDFNGTSRRVNIPDSPEFKLTNSLTLEGWIYPRQSGGLIILRGDNRPGLDPWRLDMFVPGSVTLLIINELGQSAAVAAPIQLNQWQHVAATLEGSTGDMKMYVNGALAAQTNTTIRPAGNLDANYEPAVGIGNHGGTVHQFPFNGLIDEMAVYARALSGTEIQAIYGAGGAGKCGFPAGVAPAITLHPRNQSVPAGSNVTFTVTATGTAPLSYQWRRNETNLPGATGTSLTLSNVQLANAGTYSVRVTNAFGVATSSNAVLTVALAIYDVSANYSLVANPNGVWRYGALSNLAGPLTLLPSSRTFSANNGVPIGEWNPGGVLHPHVNKVLGPGTAVSAGGAFVGPAGTVYFTPGEDGTAHNFGVFRFTVPAGGAGAYRIETVVRPLFDGALSADADFHVDKNGVQLFGAALGPNQGTGYSNTVTLAAGDTVDFAIGRGADGILGTTGLKIQAMLTQVASASAEIGSRLTSLVCESGTNAKLRFGGVAGNMYTVQASTNLIDWEVVGVSVADPNGICEFEDLDSTEFPCRYYRVVVP